MASGQNNVLDRIQEWWQWQGVQSRDNFDSKVYANKSESHLLGLYYLVSWKGYLEEENIWEPVLAIQHLWKLVTTFYKKHLKKPMATSLLINSALLMAKPIVRLRIFTTQQKQGRLIKESRVNQYAKKTWTSSLSCFRLCLETSKKYYLSHVITFRQFDFLPTVWQPSIKTLIFHLYFGFFS